MARTFADASSQSLSVSATPPVVAAPLTMVAWVYQTTDLFGALLSFTNSGAANQFFALEYSQNQDVFATARDGGTSNAISTGAGSLNSWTHAAAVFTDDTNRAALRDGANKGTVALAKTPSGLDRVQVAVENTSAYLGGSIAEAAVWNVALTDAEVAILAQGVSPLFVRPQSLVLYLPLIRDNDNDLVGGLNFTANNGPTVSAHPAMIYPAAPIIAPQAGVALAASIPKLNLYHPMRNPLLRR